MERSAIASYYPTQGIAVARDSAGLSVHELESLVHRLRNYVSKRGEAVEWKNYGHDRPDLPPLLNLAGFEPEETEAVLIGIAEELATGESLHTAAARTAFVRAVAPRAKNASHSATLEGKYPYNDGGFMPAPRATADNDSPATPSRAIRSTATARISSMVACLLAVRLSWSTSIPPMRA